MTGKEYLKFNKNNAKEYSMLKRAGYAGYMKVESSHITDYRIITLPDRHVFAGYYDIDNVSNDGNFLFFLSVPKYANPKFHKALIHLYEIETGQIRNISSTHAWCWQQGARVRWNPYEQNELIYNDYINCEYVCFSVNIKNGQRKRFSTLPIYDLNCDKKIGYGLNFRRLQWLRPGYGYVKGQSISRRSYAPDNDGLYCVDLQSQKRKLLFSLAQLAEQVDYESTDYHYLNHICVSPTGKRIMFFHLWTKDSLDMWRMRMLITDSEGAYIKVLEDADVISHYAWIDDDKIMATKVHSGKSCYVIYDCESGEKEKIENKHLINDGHPSLIGDSGNFISDTYPLDNSMQTLFLSNLNGLEYKPLLTAFSDPRYYIEKRCDMHPRLDENTKTINLDSTFTDGVRKIILLFYNKNIL